MSQYIMNLKYNFSRGGDILAGAPSGSPKNDLKQMDLSTYWKLTNRWSVLGRWNYNLSHGHGQAYLAGVMLESCCWAMRMVVARTFEGVSSGLNQRNLYDTSFFIQFSLKGLGNIGNRDPGSVLSETIPGYIDKFGQGD